MRPSKSKLRSLTRNTRLRLKENVYGKDREWFLNRVEKDMVYLLDESGAFGVAVKVENIDWSKFSS